MNVMKLPVQRAGMRHRWWKREGLSIRNSFSREKDSQDSSKKHGKKIYHPLVLHMKKEAKKKKKEKYMCSQEVERTD